MNRRDQEINEILVELAVISEKIDNIKEDLEQIKELESRLVTVEKQQSYAKGVAFVSLGVFSAIAAVIVNYIKGLWHV